MDNEKKLKNQKEQEIEVVEVLDENLNIIELENENSKKEYKASIKLKEKNKEKFELMQAETKLVWTTNDIARKVVMPFTARQIKIIDYAVSLIREQKIEREDDRLILKVHDILKFLELKYAGNVLKALEDDIKYIRDTSGWWNYDYQDPNKKTLFAFFNSADEIVKGENSAFEIGFNKHFLQRVNTKDGKIIENGQELSLGFNKYEIWNTKRLNSKYSILLYKKCSSWRKSPLGWFEYSIGDIKRDFLLTDDVDEKTGKLKTYNYGYIASHCLIPAQKEINEKTDIHISNIEKLPNAKKVEKVRIYLHEKTKEKVDRRRQEAWDQTSEYVDTMQEEYKEKLSKEKTRTDERRAEKRHKIIAERKDLSEFERIQKESEESIVDLIKEREEKIGKKFNSENVNKFISDYEYKKKKEKLKKEEKNFYESQGVDYERYRKIMQKNAMEKFIKKGLSKEKARKKSYGIPLNKEDKKVDKYMTFISSEPELAKKGMLDGFISDEEEKLTNIQMANHMKIVILQDDIKNGIEVKQEEIDAIILENQKIGERIEKIQEMREFYRIASQQVILNEDLTEEEKANLKYKMPEEQVQELKDLYEKWKKMEEDDEDREPQYYIDPEDEEKERLMVEEMAKDPEKYYEKMDKMYDKYFELKEKGEIVENDIPQDLNM